MILISGVAKAQLPTSNLLLSDVLDTLNETSLDDACLSSSVNKYGLDAMYCPGADTTARLSNLQTNKNMSYLKGYRHSAVKPTGCDSQTQYSGGQSYPTTVVVELGSGTGTVSFDYDAAAIPDKFVVFFNGVEVINTGYRGSTQLQDDLDAVLDPDEIIQGNGVGSDSFTKNSTISTCMVYVYAPLSNTGWSFTVGCPE